MKVQQHSVFLAAVVCIIFGGALGVWIDYPLSVPVRGLDWHSVDPVVWRAYLALPFLALLLLSLALLLSGGKRIGYFLLSMSIVYLLAVPGLIWLVDSNWLITYVGDSSQHEKMQFLIQFLGGTPSGNLNSYLKSADSFQYLPDRAHIVMGMLGWGWIVCFTGVFAVVFILRKSGEITSLRVIFIPIILGIVAIGIAGSNTLRADFNYRKGDQRLGLGDYNGALAAYISAFELDPFLANSRVYLSNVSKAYYQLGGANDIRGQLYLANSLSNFSQGKTNALLLAGMSANQGSHLERALSRMAQYTEAEQLINQSLRSYKFGDLGTAAIYLRRVLDKHNNWRHARYFLARVLSQLREFDEADRELNNLLLSVSRDTTKAVIYSALGDVHSAAGHLELAREYYAKSYKLDKTANLAAIKGLGGT